MNFIDLKRQYKAYKSEIDQAVAQVLESCQFVLGEPVQRLEEALAEFTGSRYAIGVGSGTDALILSLMALDVGPGDEVLTTPFTFIATAEAIALLGARPVFVDIDQATMNMDTEALKAVIAEREKAGARLRGIIPVGLYGQCADMDEINRIAGEHGLFVVEDACQSFGASYKNGMSCALSEIGVTSFFPAKPLGAYGDGGMAFTDDESLAKRIRCLRVHGERARYDHVEIGLNARLDALQAAILLAKVPHFPDEIRARQKAAETYRQLIEQNLPGVVPPVVRDDRTHVYAQYTVRVRDGVRDAVIRSMQKKGIPYAIHYPVPLHLQPAFGHLGYGPGDMPVAEQASREVLSLPMHPFITESEQAKVVQAMESGLRQGMGH